MTSSYHYQQQRLIFLQGNVRPAKSELGEACDVLAMFERRFVLA